MITMILSVATSSPQQPLLKCSQVAGASLRNRQLTIARGERRHPAGAGTTDGLGGGWAGADYQYIFLFIISNLINSQRKNITPDQS